jgi:DNA repair protein RadC
MAALCLIMSATAQAQMTVREVEEAKEAEANRIEAMLKDISERENYLVQHHTDPRDIMQYCQETLPKLDDAFRVLMLYAPLEARAEIQGNYVEHRQTLLNLLVQAQASLSQADAQ